MLLGAMTSTRPAFQRVDDEKNRKKMSDGLPSVGRCARYRTGAPPGLAKRPTSMVLFVVFFLALDPAVRPGQYEANTRPITSSSGFA